MYARNFNMFFFYKFLYVTANQLTCSSFWSKVFPLELENLKTHNLYFKLLRISRYEEKTSWTEILNRKLFFPVILPLHRKVCKVCKNKTISFWQFIFYFILILNVINCYFVNVLLRIIDIPNSWNYWEKKFQNWIIFHKINLSFDSTLIVTNTEQCHQKIPIGCLKW